MFDFMQQYRSVLEASSVVYARFCLILVDSIWALITKGMRLGSGLPVSYSTWRSKTIQNEIEGAIQNARMTIYWTIFYKSTQILTYADDIDIIGLPD